MSDEQDPEVVADLRLRAATERDRSRSRTAATWAPPKIVGKWKCFAPHCQNLVDVTDDAMERWAFFNDILRQRGEATLDKDKIMRCPECRAHLAKARSQKLRERVDEMAVLIRELKAGTKPERERQITDQLTKWGHEDVPGLVKSIAEGRATRRRGKPEAL